MTVHIAIRTLLPAQSNNYYSDDSGSNNGNSIVKAKAPFSIASIWMSFVQNSTNQKSASSEP